MGEKSLINLYLYNISDSIKFTCDSSPESIAFLDTTLKLHMETNSIYTALYTKLTDTHSYLHYQPAHNRICWKDDDFIAL